MKRIEIGDIFEIETPRGIGYLQYVYDNKAISELIRVFPGVFIESVKDLSRMASEKELYFVHFPLKAALRKGIVKRVGHFALPNDLRLPQKMRVEFTDKGGRVTHWHFVDYETWQRESVEILSPEQVKLSPWETWNDTLLIERMSQGWSLENWV